MKYVLALAAVLLAPLAPAHAAEPELPPLSLAIAEAHGRPNLPAGHVLHAKVTVIFGGNKALDGVDFWWTPDAVHTRMEAPDGTVAVFDGTTAWLSPADAEPGRTRFNLLTWPYFAMLPFKLDDGGTDLSPMPAATTRPAVGGDDMTRAKLTFGEDVGDSPDDWYVLYVNPDRQLEQLALRFPGCHDGADASLLDGPETQGGAGDGGRSGGGGCRRAVRHRPDHRV